MSHIIFLILLLTSTTTLTVLTPTTLSRTISRQPEAAVNVLDVAGSVQNTIDLFSTAGEQQQQLQPQEESASFLQSPFGKNTSSLFFSLQLHPRIYLRHPSHHHKSYKSLVESRLARDSFRVNSLLTKLDLSLHNLSPADLTDPVDAQLSAQALSAPLSSGTSQGSGEYFSRVGLGTPTKQYYMVVDTGSDVSWMQCQPCTDCYQQADPVYNPRSSSSYATVGCTSPQCDSLETKMCRSNRCMYQVSYGDGSYTVGDFMSETMSFGPSGSVPKVSMGCGHDNEGLFVGAAGLLGLGGGPLSLPAQLKASTFAYCLVDRDSTKSSTLDFNSAKPANSVMAKILKSGRINTFYYVEFTGMSVGGRPLSIPASLFQAGDTGGVIVDSGTAITRLPTAAYNSLRDAFVSQTQHLRSTTGVALFDTCYDLSSLRSVKIPTVSFQFAGGHSLDLPAKNYLIPVDSAGTFCFAFAPTTSPLSIIGNVQQQGTRVHYDLANSQVSFSPNSC